MDVERVSRVVNRPQLRALINDVCVHASDMLWLRAF